jgi:hypothetical protein
MTQTKRIFLYFVLPLLAPILVPPELLIQGLGVIVVIAVLFLTTSYFLYRGKSLALTFIIFLLGLNFIVRMMLFFSRTVSAQGAIDWAFAITSLLSMGLSFYLLFRLDQLDIRAELKG